MTEDTMPIVLVVDDTEENVDILVDALAEDYEIAVAMDGESALEAVEDERPDCILLDIMMPGMNGFEVMEKLQSDPETASIKVIFLSGAGDAEDKAKGMGMGAVDYIVKPFSIPDVMDRLQKALAG